MSHETFGPLTVYELPDSLKREGEHYLASCGTFKAVGQGPIEAFGRLIDLLRARRRMTPEEHRRVDEAKADPKARFTAVVADEWHVPSDQRHK